MPKLSSGQASCDGDEHADQHADDAPDHRIEGELPHDGVAVDRGGRQFALFVHRSETLLSWTCGQCPRRRRAAVLDADQSSRRMRSPSARRRRTGPPHGPARAPPGSAARARPRTGSAGTGCPSASSLRLPGQPRGVEHHHSELAAMPSPASQGGSQPASASGTHSSVVAARPTRGSGAPRAACGAPARWPVRRRRAVPPSTTTVGARLGQRHARVPMANGDVGVRQHGRRR